MQRKTFALFLAVILACSIFFSVSFKSVSANSGTTPIFWGAFVGPSHIGTLAQLQAFESLVGKGVAIWSTFQFWNRPKDSENDPNFNNSWMDQCRAHGAIPEIAFDPGDSNASNGIYRTYFSLILQGYYDSYLTNWARNASAWGHPFFIRLFHEIDDHWDTTYEAQFVQAWQYVHDLFIRNGATQISWIWSGASYMFTDDVSARAIYPGDSYVDWSGMGNYVWSDTTLDNMIGAAYSRSLSIAPSKPIMIVEIGYIGNHKDAWWGNVVSNQLPNNYSQIKALVIWEMAEFNVDVPSFKTAIALSYYSSNVYGSLDVPPLDALSGSFPTPTHTLTSTHSLAVSSGVGWPGAVIVGVFAAIAIVAVALVLKRNCMKDTKIEIENRKQEPSLNLELSR
jgi:hypothetical protein